MSKRPRVTVDLPVDKLDELTRIAELSGMSPSMCARAYIEKCLKDGIIPVANVTFSYTKRSKKNDESMTE